MIGGMVSPTVLTLLVIPAIYTLWRRRELGQEPNVQLTVAREIPE